MKRYRVLSEACPPKVARSQMFEGSGQGSAERWQHTGFDLDHFFAPAASNFPVTTKSGRLSPLLGMALRTVA